MLESVGALTGSPWIYAVVALSVVLDVFLPVLPSGVLVITAATAAAASTSTTVTAAAGEATRHVPSLVILTLCAATASVLGDLVAYRADASHIGMYAGNGQVIHAPYPGASVRYDPVGMMPVSSVTRV